MFRVGAASQVINNEVGRIIQGASVDEKAASIRDDSEANAMLLDDGSVSVLLVSCDLAGLESDFVTSARDAMGSAAGIPPRNVIITNTHMHSGPSVIRTSYTKPIDTEYLERLHDWLVELARETVTSARAARIGWGLGRAQLGYNRRCCWADGSHSLSGDTRRDDFIGMEGPDDPRHLGLFATDKDGKPIAILYNNTTHPTCFYGVDFYSADFPGAARASLREAVGNVPVLFLNGAFGDMSPENQLTKHKFNESREQKMLRMAHIAAGETLRLLHEADFHDGAPIAHAFEDIELKVRMPDPERLKWAEDQLARFDAGEEVKPGDRMFAFGVKHLHDEFSKNPVDQLAIHAIRVGDVAMITQPCELFCQFGLDIKRRSPAPITGVVGLADGFSGYCPTTYGILGGGYSGEPIHWTRLVEDAGCRIVDAASRLVRGLWR